MVHEGARFWGQSSLSELVFKPLPAPVASPRGEMGGPERLSQLWKVTERGGAGPSHCCLFSPKEGREASETPVALTRASLGLGDPPFLTLCPNPSSRPGMSSARWG